MQSNGLGLTGGAAFVGAARANDYGRALAGKSYRESAEYTIERFGLSQSWEEIVREWTDMAIEEYTYHVRLKPCAREYLLALMAYPFVSTASADAQDIISMWLYLGVVVLVPMLMGQTPEGGTEEVTAEG